MKLPETPLFGQSCQVTASALTVLPMTMSLAATRTCSVSTGAAGAALVSGLRVRQVERENRGDQTGGNADAEDRNPSRAS